MLRAIDIASWEAGINPANVDCDIVIVKATGGTSYTNPYWREWAQATLDSGKLLGLYHYAMEYGSYNEASAEARFFLDTVSDFKGRFVPVLDFEADAQGLPVEWPKEWLDAVAGETGSKPFFYCYASYLNSRDHSLLTEYPLWMASYLYRYDGAGWVDDPDNTWPTGSWPSMTMYQYTSTGRIGGYGGNLDLSVFYGNKDDWKRLEGTMGTAKGLIDVAYSYLGTTEDDPRFKELIDYYNEHTGGYDMRYWDEWCACFVSVCALKSGNADVTGTSVNCASFRNIWAEKGILRDRSSVPKAGWLIDYDWEQDGIPDHIGIVADCDGSTIHVIEGNTDGEMCAEHWIPVGNWSISCFGAPNYKGERKDWPLIMWPSNGNDNQKFQLIDKGDGWFSIRNCANKKVLDVKGEELGGDVILYEENGQDNQLWKPVEIGKLGQYEIVSKLDEGYVLDVKGNSSADGAGLCCWKRNGGVNQRWHFIYNGDKTYTIVAGTKRKLVLDAKDGGK